MNFFEEEGADGRIDADDGPFFSEEVGLEKVACSLIEGPAVAAVDAPDELEISGGPAVSEKGVLPERLVGLTISASPTPPLFPPSSIPILDFESSKTLKAAGGGSSIEPIDRDRLPSATSELLEDVRL